MNASPSDSQDRPTSHAPLPPSFLQARLGWHERELQLENFRLLFRLQSLHRLTLEWLHAFPLAADPTAWIKSLAFPSRLKLSPVDALQTLESLSFELLADALLDERQTSDTLQRFHELTWKIHLSTLGEILKRNRDAPLEHHSRSAGRKAAEFFLKRHRLSGSTVEPSTLTTWLNNHEVWIGTSPSQPWPKMGCFLPRRILQSGVLLDGICFPIPVPRGPGTPIESIAAYHHLLWLESWVAGVSFDRYQLRQIENKRPDSNRIRLEIINK